ncbi:chemotaxis protein CheR [Geomonas sp. Red875]|uniref:Chemotaxis protein CheR n=1 Tax=Geomesophilobacter sediminis TaxID=2798584 RepID=A0A8J7LVR4_9BACT|nr:chemotaxis protein CheR [Geomesophilobacter sediminis]
MLIRFGRFVARHLGLFYREERLDELRQKCLPLCREFGYPDVETCLLWLMSEPLSGDQLDALARTLTIGETYFLRDPASYRVLEQELLPGLIASRRAGDRRLRIWSAGCSSGEEPYSIAILLKRLIPDLAQWDVTILGTDINPAALKKGKRGVYSQWSFRDAPPWLSDYFKQRPDGRMEILPEIRSMVRFKQLNLADEVYPSAANGTGGMDLVFCRNVMLYFGPELVPQVVDRLHAALRVGGWLFVSPTEIDHRHFTRFSCRRFPGAIFFEKGDGVPVQDPVPVPELPLTLLKEMSTGQAPAWAATGFDFAPAPSGAPPAAAQLMAETPVPSATDPGPASTVAAATAEEDARSGDAAECTTDAAGWEARARQLADQGLFDAAKQCCEKAIAQDRLHAASHYLLALIHIEQGAQDEAESILKRALYIDHDFILGYFALGNLYRQMGRDAESQRQFGVALSLLERCDPAAVLPDSDGMTAGGLAEVIRRQRRG